MFIKYETFFKMPKIVISGAKCWENAIITLLNRRKIPYEKDSLDFESDIFDRVFFKYGDTHYIMRTWNVYNNSKGDTVIDYSIMIDKDPFPPKE